MPVFPTLDFMQIKERYPKAVQKITEWVFNQPELVSVTDEFIDPKSPEESKEQFTALLIQMDPRKLYDIFDSLHIHVSVYYGTAEGWNYTTQVSDASECELFSAPSRHTAEVSAFHDAFEILEKQL